MDLKRIELNKGYLFYFVLVVVIFLMNIIGTLFINGDVALIAAVSWVILSVLIYFLVRKSQKGLKYYSVLNAIISGIAMSSYYSLEDIDLFNTLIILAIFGIVMALDFIMMKKVKNTKYFIKTKIIILIFILISFIFIWLYYSASYGSGLTFMAIILLSLNISLFLKVSAEVNYTDIVGIASLLMLGGILVCVLAAITEGEALDLLPFDSSWGKNKKKANIG
ncbi:MAG: hypothetical protein ACOYIF_02565 [Acetivibrionales bacterium]|jgi:uncharacterized MnhB-related membrane protein